MQNRTTCAAIVAMAITLGALTVFATAPPTSADAVTGRVTSAAEGAMEGVVVIARREGSAILTAVTTNEEGRYRFPRTHLQAGQYTIRVRAAGFDTSGTPSVRVEAGRPAELNLQLRTVTNDELAHQLTNVDWWTSMTGTPAQKDLFVRKVVNCGFCHDMERVLRSRYTADEFLPVMQRMSTYAGDNSSACGTGSDLQCDAKTRGRFQISSTPQPMEGMTYGGGDLRAVAEYLASINLSGGKKTWDYALKSMPRPKGRATRAIVTVFPIPRQPSVIHDLGVDATGQVWYGDSGWGYLGKLDPKTGTFAEYESPNNWPDPPAGLKRIVGVQDVEVDNEGKVWTTTIRGRGMTYFDPATKKWTQFDMPAPTWAFVPSFRPGRTATVWTNSQMKQADGTVPLKAVRLNLASGQIEASFPIMVDAAGKDASGPRRIDAYGLRDPMRPFCYQIEQDLQGNFLCNDFYGSNIIAVDAKTGATKVYPTPTPNAAPRRGRRDDRGRYWFGEFWGDRLGMLDFKTQKIREFAYSTKYMSAYAGAGDRNGDGWATSNGGDRVLRVNPETGETTEYLMPVYTDARKIVVDPSTPKTTIWLPNKNLAQLIRIEPQD